MSYFKERYAKNIIIIPTDIENVFIYVYYDIALSVEATEYKIPLYKVRSGQLVQQYGNARYRVIFGKKFYGVNYSLFRYKSIYRNHIILLRQYPHNNDLKKLVKRYYKSHIKGIIFVEQNKMAKIWAIIKGTYAGLSYNYRRNLWQKINE